MQSSLTSSCVGGGQWSYMALEHLMQEAYTYFKLHLPDAHYSFEGAGSLLVAHVHAVQYSINMAQDVTFQISNIIHRKIPLLRGCGNDDRHKCLQTSR